MARSPQSYWGSLADHPRYCARKVKSMMVKRSKTEKRRCKTLKKIWRMTRNDLIKTGKSSVTQPMHRSILKKNESKSYWNFCRCVTVTWAELVLRNVKLSYFNETRTQFTLRCAQRVQKIASLRRRREYCCTKNHRASWQRMASTNRDCAEKWRFLSIFCRRPKCKRVSRSEASTQYHAYRNQSTHLAKPQFSVR